MIAYGTSSTLKIGVFIGLVERTVRREVYMGWGAPYKVEVMRKQQIGMATMSRSGTIRTSYIDFDVSKHDGIYQLKKYVVIPTPEFAINDPEIANCFILIDELKDGILKDYEEDGE